MHSPAGGAGVGNVVNARQLPRSARSAVLVGGAPSAATSCRLVAPVARALAPPCVRCTTERPHPEAAQQAPGAILRAVAIEAVGFVGALGSAHRRGIAAGVDAAKVRLAAGRAPAPHVALRLAALAFDAHRPRSHATGGWRADLVPATGTSRAASGELLAVDAGSGSEVVGAHAAEAPSQAIARVIADADV